MGDHEESSVAAELRELGETPASLPPPPTSMDNCIVVDGLPAVPAAKREKLLGVLSKIYEQIGTVSRIEMPMDAASEKSLGFAFIALGNPAEANAAVANTNGFKLSASNIFKVYPFGELDAVMDTPDQYFPLPEEEYVPKTDLRSWLTDKTGRDQFVLRHDTETEVFWHEKLGDPTLAYGGANEKRQGRTWCNMYVSWSPQGTYLATLHPQGVALWGDSSWRKQQRFAHDGVKQVQFSPDESYLVTWDGRTAEDTQEPVVKVFEVRTAKLLREFTWTPGLIKWSHDGKYAARMQPNKISIYEVPSMQLLNKESIKVPELRHFQFSPSDNVLVYWSAEVTNTPARVCIMEIPSQRVLRQKNLFSVVDCKISWQSAGDFVAVKASRTSKSKKTVYTTFELFRLREKDVPNELFELRDHVVAFSWEPRAKRFAVVHGQNPNRPDVTFYDLSGEALVELFKVEGKMCNAVFWSPRGNHCVLGGMSRELGGTLEFWDVDNQALLATQEHYAVSDVEWDPSGRVLTTAVCQPLDLLHAVSAFDNGYRLWTFQGIPISNVAKAKLYQFLWRPRPRSLISKKEENEVVRNLKQYIRRHEEEDARVESELQRKDQDRRWVLRRAYDEVCARMNMQTERERAERRALRQNFDETDDSLFEVVVEEFETILSENEEPYNP